jgi:antitoxin component YwqK of YwqJK toxin-antitoxin module
VAALDDVAAVGGGPDATPEPHVEHYADGQVKLRGFHLAGEMHGAWQFFRTDGSLMRSGSFDRGHQVGPWRTFDRGGRLVKETVFGSEPGA